MMLSLVMPCWNEAEGLPRALATAAEAAESARQAGDISAWEVVVVDDGSTDGTAAVVARAAAQGQRVRLIRHTTNRGLGAAVRSGFASARGDLVLYTDADLPCDLVHDLGKALRLLRVYDADIVSAYRHDRTGEGLRRAVYSNLYNSVVRVAFGLRVRDVNFAFKLIRRKVIDTLDLRSEGSFVDVELLARGCRAGFKTIQFGVDYFPRTRGVSTLSSTATIAHILREMATIGPAIHQTPGAARPVAARKPGRPLIINADDYGLTAGISQGILRSHVNGIVTSTSVLVVGRGFQRSAPWIAGSDTLDVGIHLAAVGEDPPVLSSREIPTLVDGRGRLPSSWRAFIRLAAIGALDTDDVEREFRAQVAVARAGGLTLSHIDTHQHLHLWPLVCEIVVKIAISEGIGAVRVPRSVDPKKRIPLNALADRLARRATDAGLVVPEWSAGLDEAGHMHGQRFKRALDVLASRGEGVAEIGCHPGDSADARPIYQWGYEWDSETEWLTSKAARAAVAHAGFVPSRRSQGAGLPTCVP